MNRFPRFLIAAIAMSGGLAAFPASAQNAPIEIYPDTPRHGDVVVASFRHMEGCSDLFGISFVDGELVVDLGPYRGQCFAPAPPQDFAVPIPGLLPGNYELVVNFDPRDGSGPVEVGRTTFGVNAHRITEGEMEDMTLPAERTTLWWLPERPGWAFVLFEAPDFGIENADTPRSHVSAILNSYGTTGEPEWFLLEGIRDTERGCAPAYQIGCREFTVYRYTGAPVFGEDQGASQEGTVIGTAEIGVFSDPDVLELTLDLTDSGQLVREELRRFTTLPPPADDGGDGGDGDGR